MTTNSNNIANSTRPAAPQTPANWFARIPRPVLLTLVIALTVFSAFQAGRKAGDKQGDKAGRAGAQDANQDAKSAQNIASKPKGAGNGDAKQGGADKGKDNTPPPGTVMLDPEGVRLAGLLIQPSGTDTLPVPLLANGTIVPGIGTEANVKPRLAGKVLKVMANIGDSVQAGQTIATLAAPELGTAQEMVHDAGLRRALAGRALARQQQYYRLGANGTPEVENARLAFAQTQGEVQADKDQVQATRQLTAQEEAKLRVQQAALTQAQAQQAAMEKKLARDRKLLDAELISRQELELAQAETTQATAQVESARATIRDAQARIGEAQANARTQVDKLANAQKRLSVVARQWQRQEALFRSGLTRNEVLVNAQAAYALAAHEVEAAEAHARLLGGPPDGDGTLPVIAPIAGKVSDRYFSPGEMVGPDKPMFTLLDLSSIVAQFAVYQEDLPHLRVGQRIAITTPTLPGQTWQARVQLIGDMLDNKTRTVKVNCLIRNPGTLLRPNMFVTGDIAGASRATTVVVPEEAVQNLDNGPMVFVPTGKPGEFHAQPVKIGETVNHRTQVLSGLNVGDQIVSKNAFLLKSEMLKGQFGG